MAAAITGSPSGCVGSRVMRAATRTRRVLPTAPGPFESAVSSSVEVGAEKAPSEAELATNKVLKKIKGKTGFLVSHRRVQIHGECVADEWCSSLRPRSGDWSRVSRVPNEGGTGHPPGARATGTALIIPDLMAYGHRVHCVASDHVKPASFRAGAVVLCRRSPGASPPPPPLPGLFNLFPFGGGNMTFPIDGIQLRQCRVTQFPTPSMPSCCSRCCDAG